MENFNKLEEKLSELKTDAVKFFEKENNAAGTRLRKGLQEIKKLAAELRKEVSEIKQAKKTS